MNCASNTLGATPEAIAASSSIFDAAIAICTIWHMLEWVRWTLLWTIALVNVNLVPAFYFFTVLNVPLGYLIAIYGFISGQSSDGACQEERARYLNLQILCFVLYIVLALSPFIFYKIQGVEKLH